MAKLHYNSSEDQMELVADSGMVETQFMVPPNMTHGDYLTPFQFRISPSMQTFHVFGRYNEEKDFAEFAVAGPRGYFYKISFSDGNSPYGWKIKQHGVIQSDCTSVAMTDRLVGMCFDVCLTMSGKDANVNLRKELLQEDAFKQEEIIGVPMAMMRASFKKGVMVAPRKCIAPWSFYGPSLSPYFCRCRMKILVYPPWEEEEAWATKKGPKHVKQRRPDGHRHHHQGHTGSPVSDAGPGRFSDIGQRKPEKPHADKRRPKSPHTHPSPGTARSPELAQSTHSGTETRIFSSGKDQDFGVPRWNKTYSPSSWYS